MVPEMLMIFIMCLSSIVAGEPQLKSVIVLFRHGDKTPTTSFPNDPYFNKNYWPMGFGELTNRGKTRQYKLGKWLRQRYKNFLSNTYSPKEIYVLSSDKDRTVMSALANLAGLFPPDSEQVWNQNLLWQPVPVHTIPLKQDSMIAMSQSCPRYTQLFNEVYNSSHYKNITTQYADVFKLLSDYSGWDVDDVHYFAQLQSVFYCYSNFNQSYLPDWVDSIDSKLLDYLAGLHYARTTFTQDMARLLIGPFLNRIISHLDNVQENLTDMPKLLMFSGHEDTLAAILHGMGAFNFVPPRFASAVIWEFWTPSDNSNSSYVNLLYKKTDEATVDKLHVKNCTFNCNYDNFKKIIEPINVNVTSWTKECQLSDQSSVPAPMCPILIGSLQLPDVYN